MSNDTLLEESERNVKCLKTTIITLVLSMFSVIGIARAGWLFYEMVTVEKTVKNDIANLRVSKERELNGRLKLMQEEETQDKKKHEDFMMKLTRELHEKEEGVQKLKERIQKIQTGDSRTPVLDELRKRYGDVEVYSGDVVQVEWRFWKSFVLQDEKCVFDMKEFDMRLEDDDMPTVDFYNKYGLVTGHVRYSTAWDGLKGAYANSSRVPAKAETVDCPLYIGEAKYYRVSFSRKEK